MAKYEIVSVYEEGYQCIGGDCGGWREKFDKDTAMSRKEAMEIFEERKANDTNYEEIMVFENGENHEQTKLIKHWWPETIETVSQEGELKL